MGGGGQQQQQQVDGNHNDGALPQHSSPPRPRRRRTHPTTTTTPGLDLPPTVASPVGGRWQPRRLECRTLQHLATLVPPPEPVTTTPNHSPSSTSNSIGTAPCDPLLCFGRYIVSATDDGRVCVYELTHLVVTSSLSTGNTTAEEEPVVQGRDDLTAAPVAVAAPFPEEGARIVCLATEKEAQPEADATKPIVVGHVWVMSSEGEVAVLECLIVDNNNNKLQVTLVQSWRTHRCSPSSCVVQQQCDTNSPNSYCWRVTIGYESGALEVWKLATTDPKQAATPLTPTLCWRGSFASPIRAVAPLALKHKTVQEKTEETASDAGATSLQDIVEEAVVMNDFVAVCLQPTLNEPTPPPSWSSVQVIDGAALERDWNHAMQHEEPPVAENMALAVEDSYCPWPSPGMELLDTSSLPVHDAEGDRRLPRRIRAQPTRGSDKLCVSSSGGEDSFVAAALSDGTLALLHASIKDKKELRWGIAHDYNQVFLSYAAVGITPLELENRTYLAACLRGGTLYAVPHVVNDEDDKDIFVFLPPEPVATESSIRYIQGFAAGNITMRGGGAGDGPIPVVVYSGVAGILDVYSCGQLEYPEQHESLFRELLENGSVQLLCDLLKQPTDDPEDDRFQASQYRLAKEEYADIKGEDQITLQDLLSSKCTHMRTLLLTLARDD